jgi:hypothetical protein
LDFIATADAVIDNVPPTLISVLLLKTPRGDITWSIVSGFKGLENDDVILAGLTDIDDDWYRGVAYVGMSRARGGGLAPADGHKDRIPRVVFTRDGEKGVEVAAP